MSKITLYVTPDGRTGSFVVDTCYFPHAQKWGFNDPDRIGAQMTFENGHTLTCTSVGATTSHWQHSDTVEVVYATPR